MTEETEDRDDAVLTEARTRLERLALGLTRRLDPLDVGGTFIATGFCVLAGAIGRDKAVQYVRELAGELEADHDAGWGGNA